jgi:chromosome segregation protein
VYVKQLELSYFKSFGSTATIPLLPGFTVVTGPNGSGKSNLLDALLFALGLAGSRGMRAERLPDLVNQAQMKRGHSIAETRVTVTFDVSDTIEPESEAEKALAESEDGEPVAPAYEFQVTRKLRVTKQGTYTSTYALNGEPCTLTDLHEHLQRYRIYPEGYNVVLQGDVTSIISMNARQRREIIDELAGVAQFDRKINQAKEKLDGVKEQEDRFHIVEQELKEQCERLDRDRQQAEKYRALRAELQLKESWEGVLAYHHIEQQVQTIQKQITKEKERQKELEVQVKIADAEIETLTATLAELNTRVKALGEDEQLAVQAAIATQEAELRQLQRQQTELKAAQTAASETIQQLQQQIAADEEGLKALAGQQGTLESETLKTLLTQRDTAQIALNEVRTQSQAIAASAQAWMDEQSNLRRQMDTLRQSLEPQRAEQVRLQERLEQLQRQGGTQSEEVQTLNDQIATTQLHLTEAQATLQEEQEKVQALAEQVVNADQSLQTTQETQERLLREQREKQRQLDKLEAQDQAQQEAQGTFATRLLLKANLPGICGLVANLGRVEPEFQLALEIAAGARIGHLVVDDDGVAAAGIDILKRERGGRATFLPLNKLKPLSNLPGLDLAGAVDYAINLIDFDPKYEAVFAYVFGNTMIFESLATARRQIGRYRMVTLDGELLEATGAITGGSRPGQQTLHFGNADAGESSEIANFRKRLADIDQLLSRITSELVKQQEALTTATQSLSATRQNQREAQLLVEQLTKELQNLCQRRDQLQLQSNTSSEEADTARSRLATLAKELPRQETELQKLQQALAELEQSQTHGEWQHLQTRIQEKETGLNAREAALREAQNEVQTLTLQVQRIQEKIDQAKADITRTQQTQATQQQQEKACQTQQQELQAKIAELQVELQKLDQRLGETKQERDRVEQQLRTQTTAQQELNFQIQKVKESQQQQQTQITELQTQLEVKKQELPDPLPEIPAGLTLETLQNELRSLQKRIQAMEPVNMLAIEEFARTQERLQDLMEKLNTLEQERTELLLRIENFTTLRHQSFKESFDAVNTNFQAIFAELSDGDGYLELEDKEDPFRGGLNLVAHPKGKPVQRLASMSGGEKSLTALSFIFALQRYRPSPFYAFDEVDSFLDGVNVERLSKVIVQQAPNAQFIVVSHRRPMIEAADRTIGVTQARGTHTQVIGMQLKTS